MCVCYSGSSPGVVTLTGLQPPGYAAATTPHSLLPPPAPANDKHVATGNEPARVFNAYDVISDLHPAATMATVAGGDDYLKPAIYWPDDGCYETVNILHDQDDDDTYYYN